MVEFNEQPTSTQKTLDATDAQEIYGLIKQFGDADKAFKNKQGSDLEPQHFPMVSKEADRLFKEMSKYASGKVVITPEQSHFDEETGEKIIDQEAVYYKLTTESDFKAQFSSDYLDVAEVYSDWKGNRTWTEIKNNTQQ
jgi:hypothetical protein